MTRDSDEQWRKPTTKEEEEGETKEEGRRRAATDTSCLLVSRWTHLVVYDS